MLKYLSIYILSSLIFTGCIHPTRLKNQEAPDPHVFSSISSIIKSYGKTERPYCGAKGIKIKDNITSGIIVTNWFPYWIGKGQMKIKIKVVVIGKTYQLTVWHRHMFRNSTDDYWARFHYDAIKRKLDMVGNEKILLR